jgi:hypothetical protein
VSKLGCTCGHLIIDQTDDLPYKGQILKDQDREAFFAGAADALREYLAGIRSGELSDWHRKWPWLRDAKDERVLWTVLGWFWRKFRVDLYECEKCGRLWVQEGTEGTRFIPFVPEQASGGRVLASEQFQVSSSPASVQRSPAGPPTPRKERQEKRTRLDNTNLEEKRVREPFVRPRGRPCKTARNK